MAVFAALAGFVIDRWWAIPAVAALWTGLERTHGPFGFAWLDLGNAGIDMPVAMRLAPITGVYGLSFVFAMIACAVALIADAAVPPGVGMAPDSSVHLFTARAESRARDAASAGGAAERRH